MRWSQFYLYTTREVPNDAEVISHQLMVRAGMMKKVAAGIYSYLPVGWRSLQKLMAIVRRELDAAGAVELSMPAIQPAELWLESGRWQRYGKELLRIKDRHERDFCFGPTHEEVITDIVRHDVRSYRQLPMNLYQIQTKFRDEIRPRFGLMRGREFIMKDAYSFHVDAPSLDTTYEAMRDAYARVFTSCHLDFTAVEADTGTIGGSASHEFMVLAATGESAVVRCPACGYAANVEKAERGADPTAPSGGDVDLADFEPVGTPGQKTVAEVAAFLGAAPEQVVKTLVYTTDRDEVAAVVFIRGDREVNEVKLLNHLGVQHLQLADDQKVAQLTGAPAGFVGPAGLAGKPHLRRLGDPSTRGIRNFISGGNQPDAHHRNVNWGRDAPEPEWVDLLLVGGGDPCPRCGAALELTRGIEVGHVFKLGTKYSAAMHCEFTDEAGASRPMVMGCYGLGIGRTVAAAIEQNHDADGIVWPLPLAPFEALLLALNPEAAAVVETAERIYGELRARGVEVLYDDRDERPGVKFKDADLIGVPLRIVVGAKSLAKGEVEISLRRDRQKIAVPVGEAVARALAMRDELAQT